MHNPGAHIVGALDRGEPGVWVLLNQARGSAPREAGASMLVTATGCEGTIGGGHLELKAIEVARERLATAATLATRRHFPLGPALGQCCGGAVDIVLVPVADADRADWLRLRAAGTAGGTFRWSRPLDTGGAIDIELHFRPWHVWVFGAGHVGRALVEVLATLPCEITWVDSRDAQFPRAMAPRVRQLESDDPASETAAIPAGADVLVMTHSHALDFDIVLPLVRRDDLGFVGVIGSGTKAATFRKRLRQRGLDETALARMVCPIGRADEGADGAALRKHPGVIAVQVASALIARQQLLAESTAASRLDIENRG
jgi:xanthine dehydrogenase accessory factor